MGRRQDEAILSNWNTLQQRMATLTERDLQRLITLECERGVLKRAYILKRLHQRFNKLRGARELKELLR